jgi:DNA-binding transcriptional MerR regulator
MQILIPLKKGNTEMKTGKVAKLFEIDPKTVTGWVDEFAEFFSEKARKSEGMQRDYLHEDLIVLNTIKVERIKRSEPEQIRAVLASGHRETALPPQAAIVGGDTAIAIYSQMKVLEVKLDEANEEIERLRRENVELQERLRSESSELQERFRRENAEQQEQLRHENVEQQEQLRRENAEQQERLRRENLEQQERYEAKMEKLVREATEWRLRHEMLEEKFRGKTDDE